MDGVVGVMTALVMMAAPAGEEALEGPLPSGSWGGRTYVGVAVPLAPGGVALEGERELDDGFSVTLRLRAAFDLGKWLRVLEDADPAYLRWGVEPGARLYLRGPVMDGLWVGARFELEQAWVEPGSAAGPGSWARQEWDVGGAVLSGYSFRLDEGFTVQAALGMGALYRAALPGVRPWTVIVAPRAQLSLGWSF
ncbi:hypothetical protein [Archangium lansingense]|uniref:Outer membrane protein beta-barrel domain-containing protein n=1 Tax=Archangium lansingense TaxID=2995310 RepID=A0ABT4APE8_9BACT|nr:hypothetical protein [Archangium lansinium]MCY1083566.1 hypothetical protein [Archangium lansinium]